MTRSDAYFDTAGALSSAGPGHRGGLRHLGVPGSLRTRK
jgi:hypothetical protein